MKSEKISTAISNSFIARNILEPFLVLSLSCFYENKALRKKFPVTERFSFSQK